MSDPENPYWLNPESGAEVEDRVLCRYVVPDGLPLWLDGPQHSLLSRLSVASSRGGTVFNIPSADWNDLVEAAGGWKDDGQEDGGGIERGLRRLGGSGGQGFQSSAKLRRVIELRSMNLATRDYEAEGFEVDDVSARESYDLKCTNDAGEVVRVEVKGTTSKGTRVFVTRGEVNRAKEDGRTDLYILHSIKITRDEVGEPIASGGVRRVISPWDVQDGVLTPIAFEYEPN